MRTFSAVVLTALLFASILLLWVPGRWPAAVLQASMFLLAMAWALGTLVRPHRLETSFVLIPMAGIVAWGLFQLAINSTVYRWETWNAVLYWTTNLVVVVLALQIFADSRLREGFLRVAVAAGFLLSIVSTFQLFTSPGRVFWLFPSGVRDFVMGPFVYRNQYAAFIELLLPLALVAAITDRRRMFVYAMIVGVMYASVVAAASRAGFVLVTAELFVVPALAYRSRLLSARSSTALIGAVLALVSLFTMAVGWNALWNRLRDPDPFVARREFLYSSLAMIRDRPWLGFGLGTWATAYPGYASFDDGKFANQAHNDWVQWACEGGLPFAGLILAIALWSVRPALRSIWGAGVIIVFLHCAIDYPVQRPALAALFFTMLGAVAARPQKFEKSS